MEVALIAAVVAILAQPLLRRWLWKRYQAGEMTGRAAGWIYAATAAAPYVLLVAYIGMSGTEDLWILILLLVITLPVTIIPWVAMFRYPRDK